MFERLLRAATGANISRMGQDIPDIGIATLNQRHHAAWLEHGVRLSLRQNAVQIFLASSVVIFGFALQEPNANSDPYNARSIVVGIGIPLLALFTSALIALHNTVILRLAAHMTRIETVLAHALPQSEQRYFSDPETSAVHQGHGNHRFWHRVLLAIMIFLVNLAAVLLSAIEFHAPKLLWVSIPITLLSSATLFHGVRPRANQFEPLTTMTSE